MGETGSFKGLRWALLISFVMGGVSLAAAQSQVSLALMPAQVVTVKGDVTKFRAMTWLNDGVQSGIKNLSIESDQKDVKVSFSGHAIPNQNDNEGELLITKEGVGFLRLNYDSLRKYYGAAGGYYPYTSLAGLPGDATRVGKDLELDIDNFSMEFGNNTPKDATWSLLYERVMKDGDKSWLSWGALRTAAATRYTVPTWQHLDQVTDTLALKNKFKVFGFNVKSEQKYEFYNGNSERPEVLYDAVAPTVASTNNKIRNQKDEDQTKSISSTFLADRWSVNDKTYFSMGYRFERARATQNEVMREYTKDGIPIAYSNPKAWDGSTAVNEDTHVVTGHIQSHLTDQLIFATKLRVESIDLNGGSSDAVDCGTGLGACGSAGGVTPDGITNYTYYGTNENDVTAAAESFSLRYTGLAKTTLYSEFEMGQERNWKSLQRTRTTTAGQTAGSDGSFYRETMNTAPEWEAKVGARVVPIRNVSAVMEYSHENKEDKLKRIVTSSATLAQLYNLNSAEDAVSSKLSWKPMKWLESSFRVKLYGTAFRTQYASQEQVKTHIDGRDFVYGLTLMPADQWMFNLSHSVQMAKTSTPLSGIAVGYDDFLPPSTSNVYNWEFSTSYAPTEKLSFFNVVSYSRAKNDLHNWGTSATRGSYMYGTNDEWYSNDFGAKLGLKKDWTLEPHYAYYGYRTYESVNTGNYSAHVLWLDVSTKW